MKPCFLAFALLCATLLAGTARADAIPFSYSGPGVRVSGTFLGSSNSDGSWTITGIEATYNRVPVSEIVPLGADPRFRYDNLYYPFGHGGYAVDSYGIAFRVPGYGDVKLCADRSSRPCGLRGDFEFEDDHGRGGYLSILWNGDDYQFTQVRHSEFGPAVPEPASLLLWGGGVAAASAFTRRFLR